MPELEVCNGLPMLVHGTHEVSDALAFIAAMLKAEREPRRSHRCFARQIDEVVAPFEHFGISLHCYWALARDEVWIQRRVDIVNVIARAVGIEQRHLPL